MKESLRKAAILITALDAKSADALLDQMGPTQAAEVRAAVMELDDVPLDVQRQVLEEFKRRRSPPTSRSAKSGIGGAQIAGASIAGSSMDGVELDDSLARRLEQDSDRLSPDGPVQTHRRLSARPKELDWLDEIPTEFLSQRLSQERPQVLATVVARLSPARAADLLARFSESRQAEIAEQLIYRDEADPTVVAEIEQLLHVQFSDEQKRAEQRRNGIATLASIVAAAPAEQRQNLVQHLTRFDQQLANELPEASQQLADLTVTRGHSGTPKPVETEGYSRPKQGPSHPPANSGQDRTTDHVRSNRDDPEITRGRRRPSTQSAGIAFEVLETLDDAIVIRALQGVDPEVALLAMAGASRELMRRVVRRLPAPEARVLQRQLDQIGPVRLREIEEAQKRVGQVAASLEV